MIEIKVEKTSPDMGAAMGERIVSMLTKLGVSKDILTKVIEEITPNLEKMKKEDTSKMTDASATESEIESEDSTESSKEDITKDVKTGEDTTKDISTDKSLQERLLAMCK